MKKFVTAALLAVVVMPAAAQAQSRGELRRDRQEIREEQRELGRAVRSGNQNRVREERRDVREARREYREDLRDRDRNWRDNDWRDWRGRNRGLYARGHWNAPFRYTRWSVGARIGANYFAPRYRIADPWRYRLPRTGPGQVWVRHFDDLLLVNTRTGRVVRVINGFYW